MLKKVHDVYGTPLIFRSADRKRLYVTMFSPVYLRKRLYHGERDLLKLAREESSEASWLYCHDDSTWYGIGGLSVERETGPEVTDYPFDYSQLGKRFSHYYTHMKTVLERRLEFVKQFKGKSRVGLKGEFVEDYWKKAAEVLSTLPSQFDIKLGLEKLQQSPKVTLDFRIASSYGITDISYNDPTKVTEEGYSNEVFNLLLNGLPRVFQTYAKTRKPVATEKLINEGIYSMNSRLSGIRLDFRPMA